MVSSFTITKGNRVFGFFRLIRFIKFWTYPWTVVYSLVKSENKWDNEPPFINSLKFFISPRSLDKESPYLQRTPVKSPHISRQRTSDKDTYLFGTQSLHIICDEEVFIQTLFIRPRPPRRPVTQILTSDGQDGRESSRVVLSVISVLTVQRSTPRSGEDHTSFIWRT